MRLSILNFFTGIKSKIANVPGDTFADFFLHASDAEKRRVFTEAARRANEDQRSLVENINKLESKTT